MICEEDITKVAKNSLSKSISLNIFYSRIGPQPLEWGLVFVQLKR